jgi:predicted AlkP superfamily pyrophosphatase or phosphodiesterase
MMCLTQGMVRQQFSVLLLFIVPALLLSCAQSDDTSEKTPKALFIILDGISADVIEKVNPPALSAIAETGGYTRAYVGGGAGTYSETPTISAVGYNSLLTGTWANKHNVWDNDIEDPNYHYKTIFSIAEAFNPDLHTAVFSTWTDNRTKLIGENLEQTKNIRLDHHFDGLELDTAQYPHDDQSDYIHQIDEAVADEAARYIAEKGPDLSWVYLQYTDDMGHRHGDSEEFYNAIRLADAQVGRIWSAIREREQKFDEDWLIVVTTDHGRDSISGKHHGGQSYRERLTWIYTNADSLNERFRQTPAVVDIMPSICNHMGIRIPDPVKQEIDAIPFIGAVDFSDLTAEMKAGKIRLRWQGLAKENDAKAEVLVASTNHFRDGGKDTYVKAGEVFITDEQFAFDAPEGTDFLKVLVKGPHHTMNVWVDY